MDQKNCYLGTSHLLSLLIYACATAFLLFHFSFDFFLINIFKPYRIVCLLADTPQKLSRSLPFLFSSVPNPCFSIHIFPLLCSPLFQGTPPHAFSFFPGFFSNYFGLHPLLFFVFYFHYLCPRLWSLFCTWAMLNLTTTEAFHIWTPTNTNFKHKLISAGFFLVMVCKANFSPFMFIRIYQQQWLKGRM